MVRFARFGGPFVAYIWCAQLGRVFKNCIDLIHREVFTVLRFILASAIVLLFSGCAFTPHAVVIQPKIEGPSSDIGKNRELPLVVVDERTRQTIGTRGARGIGADMTIDGNLTTTVRNALAEGLAMQKFKVTSTAGNSASELRVEIRNLDYGVIVGFWAGTLRVDVGLKAICTRGSSRPYEMLHRGEHVESVQVVQSTEANNMYVSSAVSQAVNSLLKDEQLVKCLAG